MRFLTLTVVCVLAASCTTISGLTNSLDPRKSAINQRQVQDKPTPLKKDPTPPRPTKRPLVTADKIRTFAPHMSEDYVAVLSNPEVYKAYDITTPLRVSHFMAQIAHESAGFKRLDENLNYSAKGLRAIFRSRVTAEKAQALHRKPKQIANWVYGGRLGNRGQDTNDGWNYRGSGFIQLTGRSNFLKYGKIVGTNIAASPELARQPEVGLQTALAYWSTHGLSEHADRGDLCKIRRRINGGYNGIDESFQWYQRAIAAFDTDPLTLPDPDGIDGPADIPRILDILSERGINVTAYDDPADNLTEALKVYQRSRGLTETGELDLATLTAISDHREHDLAVDDCKR